MSALEETLELLEWPRLCQQLSSFASTLQGRRHCALGALPASLSESLTLQARTQEIASLDGLLDGGLSFQGVGDLDMTLLRCSRRCRLRRGAAHGCRHPRSCASLAPTDR